jgi:hypothetical protein
MSNPCSVENCNEVRVSHGLCDMHRYWLNTHGNLDWKPIRGRELVCVECGASFIAGRIGNKFCSKACGARSWRRDHVIPTILTDRLCGFCNTSFIPTSARQKHCSPECTYGKRKHTLRSQNDFAGYGWSKGKEFAPRVPCELCGAPFHSLPAYRRRGGGRFCSNRCRTKDLAMNPSRYPQITGRRSKPGKRADLNGQFFRSSWEANYARYLNWLISLNQLLRWEFEPDTFEFHTIKRGSRFYTPDFKVFENDGRYAYHEVKGWMDPKSQTKLNRMAKYYPNEKVILIDKVAYRSIEKQMKNAIPNWE